MARGIVEAYLAGEARAFFPADPARPEDRARSVARAARPLEPAVADELEAQNARLCRSAAREANLRALRAGAAAVVTGQQVGLFGGPLFTLYKAASAIALARALAAETGRAVVPIFWLQTEDHDLAEIASIETPTSHGTPLSLGVPADPANRISVAHLSLPGEVEAAIAELRGAIGHLPHGEEHLERLARHYRAGAGWKDAFAGLLAELFAEEGLVFVDPRVPALAARAAPLHVRALEGAALIADALLERTRALEAAGYAAAVHVRAGAPLSFFHPGGAGGPRFRLEPRGGGFAEVGGAGVHALPSLLDALERDPLSFGTSALLRPILQDTLLPTAAYVGGPGELAYFAQLSPLYSLFDLQMPLVVPRARFRIVDDGVARRLSRLGLAADDVAAPPDELLRRCGPRGELETDELVARLLGPFEEALGELRLDEAVRTAARKTKSSVERSVRRFAAKVEAARLRRDRALVDELRKLRAWLQPDGEPQERRYGISGFAARHGERALVELVLARAAPLDGAQRELRP